MIGGLFALTLLAAPACVSADIGNVRVLPADGEVMAGRLRIGTPVNATETRGDWVRVEAGALRGWMKATLLEPVCPTVAALVEKSRTAKDVTEKVRWADRALTLDPFSPAALDAAAEAYAKAKIGGVKALALKEMLQGKTAVFLASCLDGDVILVAQQKPSGLEALLTSTDMLPPASELAKILPAFAGAQWFSLSPDGTGSRLGGTPFPAASIVTSADGLAHVKLGGCTDAGTLYATRAIEAAGAEALAAEAAVKVREEMLARTLAAVTSTDGAFAPTRFDAGFFDGEMVRERGLGAAQMELPPQVEFSAPVLTWAMLEGTRVVETVGSITDARHDDRVLTASVAELSDGRRLAVIAHRVGDASAAGAGRRFTVLAIASDGTHERLDLAVEYANAPAD